MNNLRDHNDLSAQTSFHNLTILGEHRGGGGLSCKAIFDFIFLLIVFFSVTVIPLLSQKARLPS